MEFPARYRKVCLEPDYETSTDMTTPIKHSGFRFKGIPIKARCFVIILALLALYLFVTIYFTLKENRLTKEEFLDVYKCPACYGHSFCFALFDDQFSLQGVSRYSVLDVMNVKNVHFAYHKEGLHQVVLKKLAHVDELQKVDDEICKDSVREPGCDVAKRMVVSKTAQDIGLNGLLPGHLKDTTFMFLCVTHKLIDRVLERYKERSRPGVTRMDDYLQILYTARVNPEPLMLQTFPASEGWPFPEYLGACGRYIVQEYNGKSLADFVNAPFQKRADLAYQMMKMADRLTSDPDWNLYWTDLVYNNFAVDEAGKLTYIDAENIVVVDKQATKISNPKSWDDLAESEYIQCDENRGNDCLTFDTNQLCTHHMADHNYFAVCRNVLSSYADNRPTGGSAHLLHDIPDKIKHDWDLEILLNECVRPHYPQGRYKVAHKLMQALEHIRDSKKPL